MSNNVHDIINIERKKRGLPHVYWSRSMAQLASSQANYCASIGRMVHSARFAFRGGENLCGGQGIFSPRQVVNSWLQSKQGHREYILSPRVTKAGVGISRKNGKMFVAWAFSDIPPTQSDCPNYKPTIIKLPGFFNIFKRRHIMRFNPFKIGFSLILGFVGFLSIVLGAHGFYIYFNRIDLFLSDDVSKLFLVFDTPARLDRLVIWATHIGIQSWFLPLSILLAGLWLFNYSRLWDIVSSFFDKIRP